MRTEGMGIRATGRVLEKPHASIIGWERRVAAKEAAWTASAPSGGEITVEGDEVYTRGGENLPPEASEGWTIDFLERRRRYWLVAQAGKKDASLFEQATCKAWEWAKDCQFVRWFTDGEKR